jgi:uncharacterized delta-60 repeat protein
MKNCTYLLLFIISFSSSWAQQGSPDNSFNSNGKALASFYYDFGNGPEITGQDYGAAIVVQADGKVIVAGRTYNGLNEDLGLIRYNSNGTLDNTFDVDGYVNTGFGASDINDHERITALALQPDGKILAVGTTASVSSTADYAIVRYKPDGTLDSSFGTNGHVFVDFGDTDEATCVAIQNDGKILVAGFSVNGTDTDFSLARLNTDGSLDNSFDGDGRMISVISPRIDYLTSMVLQPDGKIVVGGQTNLDFVGEFVLARFNDNGTPDNSFDGDGKAVLSVGPSSETITGLALQPDGKIVAAGYGYNVGGSNNDFIVARFLDTGSPDNTFDGNGSAVAAIGTNHDYATSVAIQNNGQIIVAGYSLMPSGLYDFSLVKFHSNGTPDNTFDGDGKVLSDIGGNDIALAVALTSSRIYVAGTDLDLFNSGVYKMTVAAFQNSNIALPLQLIAFTGSLQNNNVLLQWKTTAEYSTSHFDIERSTDGTRFQKTGTVSAVANSSVSNHYSFNDISGLTATTFYRLKMVDLDGSFSYSKVVAVKVNTAGAPVVIFPNPATDLLHVQTSNMNGVVVLSIIDAAGKLYKKESGTINASSAFSLDISMFSKGLYHLMVETDDKKEVHRFIKN